LAGAILASGLALAGASSGARPRPPGRLVDLGGHRLHVHCTGAGSPVVVVENGLGDFSFDWILVQDRVSRFTRICTYDRAGYAWSDPGPKPRTFAQLNIELRGALRRLGERGPFVLVGHSFGGPVVRQFATAYPDAAAGMVLVDSVFEDQRIPIQGKAVRLRDGAVGKQFPTPREAMTDAERPAGLESPRSVPPQPLDPVFLHLPSRERRLHAWAAALPTLADAEDSQREWSTESFALMHATRQAGSLGAIPLIVLTRAEGGYSDNLDVSATELDHERKEGQATLALLSTNSKQLTLACGHSMQLEAPGSVAAAIREVVQAVRNHTTLTGSRNLTRPLRRMRR
jgi:pimeloyl-ACP methyl ester carboxylesterase